MKAIGYIRVSTEEQSADDKYGIEVQKQAISDYANRNDFEIVCWLTDTISGAKDNRPELDKILYNADQLPADEVTVKAFQNGVALSPLVPTGDRTNGYVQCDSNVQSGTTADVVWLFELDDDSTVSVELSGGEKVEIPLTEE